MKNFVKLAEGLDVAALAMQLQMHPELWNSYAGRKNYETSPHRETSDIWLRYNDLAALGESYAAWTQRHDSVWLPPAASLPALRPITFKLMALCEAVRLGGMLITKIPPGGRVLPHIDTGWHPTYYNAKIYVPLAANERCVNIVENERVTMRVGEAWYFDNTKLHAVKNEGDSDRITLIICLRLDHALLPKPVDEIRHHFAPGVYFKRAFVRAGRGIETHAHEFDHTSILASGSVLVKVEGITTRYSAPAEINIAAGKKHTIAAIDDSVWYCVHATTETDVATIDKTLTGDRSCPSAS